MSLAIYAETPPARLGESRRYQQIVTWCAAVFVFCGVISLVEPSPYDFASFVAIPLWFFGGFRVNRFLLAITIFWLLWEAIHFIALTPHWDDSSSVLYQLQSLYLAITVIFFTLFFAERTDVRLSVCLDAYTASAVMSGAIAIMSYLSLFGLQALITLEGRVAGTFKDPNVFGPYAVLGACWLLHGVLLGRSRVLLVSLACFAIILTGVFLSFSRGAWGATTLSLVMTYCAVFVTAETPRLRRRIVLMGAATIAVIAILLAIILAQDSIREFFLMRAAVKQDYDSERFGNQLQSLHMLLELPLGFGPLRFREYFGLEPHNSYIGAFANAGWLGGFLWFLMVGSTTFVGFRLMFKPSPYRHYAQAVFPALFGILLQGFQIDIDHWRFLYFDLGAIWGMEAARRRWLSTR
ncbi:MAG TPA: O-antigen ligase domain-containing protein [Rhodoblastus sp.]|nr:O-antigen ligase domain-containing protein [Rhodoblastus sp.]